ncbi:hypothetical protein DFH07DRAFT_48842 [Mycena maculata]|uniref:Glycosyltransferase family 1 protein n=1 Tax=Mycena maculata TaxID=230809 RepID=A0AAD7IHP7_9AGAR|nr:hypothetical protein DFH07DRAFT_48842 [Mycena maculata]
MTPLCPNAHAVVFTAGLWGHTRPMCAFAARLINERPNLLVSFMTIPAVIPRAREEVTRFFAPEKAHLKDSIRFIALPEGVNFFNSNLEGVEGDFVAAYEALLAEDLPFPAVFVVEMSMPVAHGIVRARSKGITKVVTWCPISLPFVVSAIQSFGEKSVVEVVEGLKSQALREGKTYQELADDLFRKPLKGDVYSPPDLPKISDYELFPQELEFISSGPRGEVLLSATQGLMNCDGAIGVSSRVIEPATCEWIQTALRRKGGDFFLIGPLMPPVVSANGDSREGEFAQSASESRDVETFLNRMLVERGPHSVLYISFGSIWQPLEPPKFWAFLEAVVEKKIPFILTDLGSHPPLPAHLQAAVADEALGLLRKWVPQQFILSHPATGWFLTHCGVNGTLESLTAGVPMICWPLVYDQPSLAMSVSQVLGCGFELSEVRQGLGLKYRASTGKTPVGTPESVKIEAAEVLERAFNGTDGKAAREKVQRVATQLGQAWDGERDGAGPGEALSDLRRFIQTYLPY